MTTPHAHPLNIASMPLVERIALAQELWDSVYADAHAAPFSPEQLDEIERRIATADAGQYAEIPAETVLGRLAQRR